MNVTSALFEAFLKCPTKCYLRSTGQAGGENAYAEWVRAQNDAYRSKTAKQVIEAAAENTSPGTRAHEQVAEGLESSRMVSSLHRGQRKISPVTQGST